MRNDSVRPSTQQQKKWFSDFKMLWNGMMKSFQILFHDARRAVILKSDKGVQKGKLKTMLTCE